MKNKDRKGRKIPGLNINIYLTLIILAIFTVTMLLSSSITFLLDVLFGLPVEIPAVIWVVLFSIVLGTVFTAITSRYFLAPITRLTEAMTAVTEGDFSITLDEKIQISEIRESYSSFNIMVRELASTEILQTDFVSNVSHEFKTPINAIEGYAMLLQEETDLPAEEAEYIEKILFNTKRLSSLVGNILLLSRLENQSIQSPKEKFRMDEQIRKVIVLLEPQWSEKEISFEIDMPPILFLGWESLLSHVWTNLIGNAVKFSPFQGSIRICAKTEENQVAVMVQDSGSGISPEEQRRVFEKFYQADSSRKNEGNGLGLALVKQIVELSGGTVKVENASEGGCLFTVTLPLS